MALRARPKYTRYVFHLVGSAHDRHAIMGGRAVEIGAAAAGQQDLIGTDRRRAGAA